MTTKLTTRQAVQQVLTGRRKPMRVPAIIEAAVPLTRPGTPTATWKRCPRSWPPPPRPAPRCTPLTWA